jgi:hypothetical protein
LLLALACSSTPPLYSTVLPAWHGPMQPQHLNLEIRDVTMYCTEVPPKQSFFHLILFSLFFNKCTTYCIFPQIRALLHPCCGVISTIYSSKEGRGAINILAGIAGRTRTDGITTIFVRAFFWVVPSSIHQSTNRSIDHCRTRKERVAINPAHPSPKSQFNSNRHHRKAFVAHCLLIARLLSLLHCA